jgi:Ni,Fe-hydrogenase III large subunit
MTATALIRAGQALPMRPWPRYLLSSEGWRAMVAALADQAEPAFLGLWADAAQVHALFLADAPLLASAPVEAGLYAAPSRHRPGAARFERMVADLWGHVAAHGADSRPMLDHGHWPTLHPLSPRALPYAGAPEPPEFLAVPGAGQHVLRSGPVAVGPVGGGIGAPAHLHVTAAGSRAMRLEARTGYAHRGCQALLPGPLPAGARLAGRLNGEATVAHSTAFAHAAEAALGVEAPPRARALRGVMQELERLAIHLAVLASVCAAAGDRAAALRAGSAREGLLRASAAAFGHRLLMDAVVPGGVAADLAPGGDAVILGALDAAAAQDLMPAAVLDRLGGIGRAGQALHPAGPAGGLEFGLVAAAAPAGGDAAARVRARLQDLPRSAALLRRALDLLPPGPLIAALPAGGGEGLGTAEGPHGAVWHWLRLDGGSVADGFALDPAWLHLPLAEDACAGAALADVPLILASVAAAVPGMDL